MLNLEKLPGLASLAELTECQRLEQLALYDSRPADKRLDFLLQIPSLRHLVASDVYPSEQVTTMRDQFRGETLVCRSETVRGDLANVDVRWRAPVHPYLGVD